MSAYTVDSLIEQRANSIVFHEGGSIDDRVRQRARQEAVSELISDFKTAEELRSLLHYLAREAGITTGW